MKQPHRQVPILLGISCLAALVAAGTGFAAHRSGVHVSYFTCDPSALGHLPWWTGVVSKLGSTFWALAVFTCFTTAHVLRSPRSRSLLRFGGAVGLVFHLDDTFLLHEGFGAATRLPDHSFFVIHATLLGIYLLRFRVDLLRHDWLLLGAALAGFALSLALDADLYAGSTHQRRLLVEDGSKFAGILLWCAFHLRVSAALFRADSETENVVVHLEHGDRTTELRRGPGSTPQRPEQRRAP